MKFRSIIAAVALLLAATAPAQTSASRASLSDPALDALVAEALANAPEISAARSISIAARHRIVPAATLPDPFISTTYQNDGRSLSLGKAEGSFLGLMVSQTIPWPGKLSLAGRVAESEAKEIERGAVGRSELAIEARVRNAWYDLLLARAIDGIIDDRHAAAAQIEATTRARYAAGLGVQQDVLRAQIELARLDELKATQQATIAARTAEINRLVGSPQDRAIDTPATLPSEATLASASTLIAAAAQRSPEIASAAQALESGRLRVDLARRNFLPDFTVNGGSMYRGSFAMGPMWQVGVGVSVPLWIDRRQQNQLAEAKALADARTADQSAVALELELRTRERIAQLQAALRIARTYRESILPLDELSLESALASYQSAKLPFISVLDALNTLYGDRATLMSRLAEAAKWRVAIDEASLQPTAMSATAAMSSGSASAQTPAPATAASGGSSTSMR